MDVEAVQGIRRHRPGRRMHEHRTGLAPAEATVRTDQLLEGGHLTGPRIEPAEQHQIPDVVPRIAWRSVLCWLIWFRKACGT